MGTFNEFAAFAPPDGGAGSASSAGAGAGVAPAAAQEPPAGAPAGEQALNAAQQQAQQQAQAALVRDIVTGELLPAGEPGGSLTSGRAGGPAKPVRDIRMEPVAQVARWLGSPPADGSLPRRGSGGPKGPDA